MNTKPDTKTEKSLIRTFRSILSPKGARYAGHILGRDSTHDGARYLYLAYAHARGLTHAQVEPRVRHDNLPSPKRIRDMYGMALQATYDAETGWSSYLPSLDDLQAWATVPLERQRIRRGGRSQPMTAPEETGTFVKVARKVVARLYLVVRANLPPGDQAVQADHAHREFIEHHREVEAQWYRDSNTLALLAARDEAHLDALYEQAQVEGVAAAPFREPDLGGSLTAVAFGPAAGRLFSGLPLALRAG